MVHIRRLLPSCPPPAPSPTVVPYAGTQARIVEATAKAESAMREAAAAKLEAREHEETARKVELEATEAKKKALELAECAQVKDFFLLIRSFFALVRVVSKRMVPLQKIWSLTYS